MVKYLTVNGKIGLQFNKEWFEVGTQICHPSAEARAGLHRSFLN